MKRLSSEYKRLFKNKKYKKSFLFGIILLLIAAIVSSLVISYADTIPGDSLRDLILDNIPTIHLFWFRTFGIAFIIISVLILALRNPKYFPILSKSVGLMYIIRAVFIILTSLKHPNETITLSARYPSLDSILFNGNDLFFSGHVAFPFLVSLIFWDNKKIRYIFISFSVISGIVSLFAKTHYSIDVFAAPFITYGIFKISEKIFREDFYYIKIKQKNKI